MVFKEVMAWSYIWNKTDNWFKWLHYKCEEEEYINGSNDIRPFCRPLRDLIGFSLLFQD